MSSQFEDALNEYLEVTQTPTAPQLPDGFTASADPQYAYNAQTGHWLDIASNTISYYDAETCTYVPVDTQDMLATAYQFEGVVRLVIVESTCFTPGQVADVDVVEGLSVGRDEIETGVAPHLRIQDVAVSRFHAKIYAGDSAENESMDDVEVGSEDGEIEEPENSEDGAKYSEDGECSDHEAAPNEESRNTLTLYVVDQGSTHGTFVNEKRLSEAKCSSKPHAIAHMDRVSFGQCVFEVHIHEQWACARCSTSENDEIPTRAAAAPIQQPQAKVTKLAPNIQQERIDNLKALKRKFMVNKGEHKHKTGKHYTDRAKLRRTLQPEGPASQNSTVASSQAPDIGEEVIDQSSGNDGRAGLGLQNMSENEQREYKQSRLTRDRYMSSL